MKLGRRNPEYSPILTQVRLIKSAHLTVIFFSNPPLFL